MNFLLLTIFDLPSYNLKHGDNLSLEEGSSSLKGKVSPCPCLVCILRIRIGLWLPSFSLQWIIHARIRIALYLLYVDFWTGFPSAISLQSSCGVFLNDLWSSFPVFSFSCMMSYLQFSVISWGFTNRILRASPGVVLSTSVMPKNANLCEPLRLMVVDTLSTVEDQTTAP